MTILRVRRSNIQTLTTPVKYHKRLLICVAVLACTACAGQTAHVRGVAPLNRNAVGESTPVDLRFYLLRDQAAFARAGFAALWTEPGAVLGSDLIAPPVVATVLPGGPDDQPQSVALGTAQARWVGVQMLSRRDDGEPRTLLVESDRLPGIVIEASGSGLRMSGRR